MTRSLNRVRRQLVSLLGIALCCVACSGDQRETTTGKRITLHTVVQGDAAVAEPFVTGTGWNVTLSSAALAIGGLYYFDGTPAFVRLDPPRRPLLRRLERLLIGVAYAHPQHYVAGNALGQMTSSTSADLLAGPSSLPDGEGVTGTYRSARLLLPERNAGPLADELDSHVAVAAGVATKDDKTVYFRVHADLADIMKTSPAGEIDGSVFDEVAVEAEGTVTLTIKPSTWFNLVDFGDVEPGTAEAPTALVPGEAAHIGFALGVAQLSAYHYAYEP
jgi:hypothetical protein